MSLSVNRVNNNILFKANEKPEGMVNTEKEKTDKGLSDSEKIIMGLGILAGITIGGILVKRRLDVKATEKLVKKAQELLQKPEKYTDETFENLLQEWNNSGKLHLDAGDEVFFMNKNALLGEGWSDYYKKLHSAMKLSDNGFAIVVVRKGKEKSLVKYYDPKEIESEFIKQAVSSGKDIVKFDFQD